MPSFGRSGWSGATRAGSSDEPRGTSKASGGASGSGGRIPAARSFVPASWPPVPDPLASRRARVMVREGRGAMARVPFALLLAFSLAATVVTQAGPHARPAADPGVTTTARYSAAAPGLGARPQSRCHGSEVSRGRDPRDLLVRIATAAIRVVAQMLQAPRWPGAQRDHDLLWGDDLTAAIDALWSCLTEASRTTAGSRGDWP